MVVDLGTGDGRAVLARAAASPRDLVIGIDADARSMADASRRASRGSRNATNGSNVLFVVAAAESIPDELAGVARELTVNFPWGSLLRGVLGLPDASAATAGIASLLDPAGRAAILVSIAPRDGIAELDRLDEAALDRLERAHAANGLRLVCARPATREEILASRSSWGRRLGAGSGERAAWRIDLVRGNGPEAARPVRARSRGAPAGRGQSGRAPGGGRRARGATDQRTPVATRVPGPCRQARGAPPRARGRRAAGGTG